MKRRKQILTTGEVARICHVAPRTVSKWFDSGKLRGYRIPGSRDRRIPLQQLMQFMRAYGMPLDELEGGATRILIVDPDLASAAAIAERLSGADGYDVRVAGNDFEAGMLAGKFEPHVIVVDVVSDAIDAREILGNIRANPNLSASTVVAVAGKLTSAQTQALLRDGFGRVLTRPYGIEDLLGAVEEAVEPVV